MTKNSIPANAHNEVVVGENAKSVYVVYSTIVEYKDKIMKRFEIKAQIISDENGENKLRIIVQSAPFPTIENGWGYCDDFQIIDSRELRTYLKSDEFRDFAFNILGKYEGLTYDDMHDVFITDIMDDLKKVGEQVADFWGIKEKKMFN